MSTTNFGRAEIPSSAMFCVLLALAGCADASQLDLPAPTGDRSVDRSSVIAAFDSVLPGQTIAFAAGTYLVGGERLVLDTPDVTLQGHPDGTTLLGCTDEEMDTLAIQEFWERCNGLVLAAEGQRVSDLRFESFYEPLNIREPTAEEREARPPAYSGGHVIENNVFERLTGVYVRVHADSTVRVRRNVFRDTWHTVVIGGRNVWVVDNDMSVPDPERVPDKYPGGAVGMRPDRDGVCESVLVEGNRIEGYTEGVMIGVFPQDSPGSACSDITVRDNEIVMRPVRFPADNPRFTQSQQESRVGKLAIAPAIRLYNAQPLVYEGSLGWPARWMPEGGWPPELADARIHDITVEGNRITGAVGVGIDVVEVSDSRITGNVIDVRPAVTEEEMEGISLGGNGGPGGWVRLGFIDEANGAPVWVSPGSEGVVVENGR